MKINFSSFCIMFFLIVYPLCVNATESVVNQDAPPADGVITLNDGVNGDNNGVKKPEEVKKNQLMQHDYPAMRREVIEQVRDGIVEEKINNVVPITPDQIMRYKKKVDEGRKAAAEPVNGHIELMNETIPLVVGSKDKVYNIYLSTGFVTSVVFLDAKGNPWPVKVAVKGDGTKISTTRVDKHLVFMSTGAAYSDTNMSFVLEGINVPINFRVITNTERAHERIEVVLQQLGPEAKPEEVVSEETIETVNSEMYSFLDMLPPEKATEVKVNGFHANAWVYKNNIYVRTSDSDLISPAYEPGGMVEGGDGGKVYRMKYSPIVMFAYKGKVYQAHIDVPTKVFNEEIANDSNSEKVN